MAIICQASLGDTAVTLFQVKSLDPQEQHVDWYVLHFLDMPTNKSESISYGTQENDAVMAFAAWLASDTPLTGCPELSKQLAHLYEMLGTNSIFLP